MLAHIFLLGLLTASVVPCQSGRLQSLKRPERHDDPQARWYPQFSIEFNETSKLLFRRETEGKWWYDAVNQRERIYRQDGRGDRYCGSIHAFTTTPCVHIVVGGARYLHFPELNECCLCCFASQGCGILSPKWLDNSTFEGTTQMYDKQVYKFSLWGLQPNYYYATADSMQLPVELDQVPNDYQTLHTSTFNTQVPDPKLFKLPEGCDQKCPLTSICTLLSLRGWGGRQ